MGIPGIANKHHYQYFTLPNGIRIVHKPIRTNVAHVGVFINAGTRDELEHENGLSHYIEHTLFKGTKKRRAYHILSRLEDVGGEINAYTSKEETCIYTTILYEHYERAIELMADITFNSTFPEKEIEKEKAVIMDEINSYNDSPVEKIYEDFESMVFGSHPLGQSILGTPEHLKTFNSRHIKKFINRNYLPSEIVISSVGKLDVRVLHELADKHFSKVKAKAEKIERKKFKSYKPTEQTVQKQTHQSHCMIGGVAYHASHKHKTALILLNNILGGPCMNSRLNMTVREKHGLAYNIESSYASYSDTGIASIYLGTEKKSFDKTLSLVMMELKKLRETPLGTAQLKKGKQQLIGQISIAAESNQNLMQTMGKSMLLFDRIDSLEKVYKEIEKVSAKELMEVSREIYDERKLSVLTYESK